MNSSSKKRKISVIVPVLNEENNLEPLYGRIKGVFEKIDYEFELIVVDDGSEDRSIEVAERLCGQDARVKFLSLSRNFGHQLALSAGLDYAQGEAVILMDADLQHPPEVISELIKKWREGYENVYAVRKITKNVSLFKKYSSTLFYHFFRVLTKLDIPVNGADFRLLDRKLVLQIRKIKERDRFLRGLIYWTGFRSAGIEYQEEQRHSGEIKYNFKKMVSFAIDAICSFTIMPLYIGILMGVIFAFLGFAYGGYAIYIYIATGVGVPGWASIISLLGILGGIQLIVMGLIGVYIGKIFKEVKQRPLYVIQRTGGIDESEIDRKNTADERGPGVRSY